MSLFSRESDSRIAIVLGGCGYVKSITSLTADPTAHVRVVYNSDWI